MERHASGDSRSIRHRRDEEVQKADQFMHITFFQIDPCINGLTGLLTGRLN